MLCHATEAVEVCCVHLRVDISCAKEQQRLKERVVDDVHQCSAHSQGHNNRVACCLRECCDTQTDEDNTDILDT